jgi:hypothetical protein
MPVLWAALHSTRLVTITFKGVISRKDMDEYADGVLTPATLSYRKLVDLTQGSLTLTVDDITALTERVRAHGRAGPMGAVAIAVGSDEQKRYRLLFDSVSAAADRPLKVFCDLQAARDWLDAAPTSAGVVTHVLPPPEDSAAGGAAL